MMHEKGAPSLQNIFLAFLRLGVSAFGGPAMVPYIRKMSVDRNQWLSEASFRSGVALIQTLPGATAMQVAAYVGLRTRGVKGALAAYTGFAIPAFVLMLVLSAIYVRWRDTDIIVNAFSGLKTVVVALVANAALDFSKRYCTGWRDALLALAAGSWLTAQLDPVIAIVGCCLAGVYIYTTTEPLPEFVHAQRAVRTQWRMLFGLALLAAAGMCILLVFLPALAGICAALLKIDIFAFGGGYVSVPLMLHEFVEVRGAMSENVFMDGIALGQLTPGPIVMTATFIGYITHGVTGAVAATLFVFTPSFLILCAASPFVDKVLHMVVVQRIFRASLATLVGLMAAVTLRFMIVIDWSPGRVLLCAAAFLALRRGVDVLWVVLVGGLCALILF